jgi:hypothetical protein
MERERMVEESSKKMVADLERAPGRSWPKGYADRPVERRDRDRTVTDL